MKCREKSKHSRVLSFCTPTYIHICVYKSVSVCKCKMHKWFQSLYSDSNVAKGKSAVQSSKFSIHGSASNAVDGEIHAIYTDGSCSHTAASGPNDWWAVDLGAPTRIVAVAITNREDCCGNGLFPLVQQTAI